MSTLLAKTRAGVEKTFTCLPESCVPFGFFVGERVLTPKGAAFVVGVFEQDLYFMIDGDRGASKWSNYKKAEFEGRGFVLLFSLRDFHLNKSETAENFANSVYSVMASSQAQGKCCCCFGCVAKDDDVAVNDNSLANQLNSQNFHLQGGEQLGGANATLDGYACLHHCNHFLAPCFKPLLFEKKFCDVELVLKDQAGLIHKIPAIRGILAARSTYFASLFNSGCVDSISRDLLIENILPHIMLIILEFIYCGMASIPTAADALAISHAANLFLLPDLKEKCSDILKRFISIENVFSLLQNAHLLKLVSLKQCAMGFIMENFQDASVRQKFVNCVTLNELPPELLCDLIDQKHFDDDPSFQLKKRRFNSSQVSIEHESHASNFN